MKIDHFEYIKEVYEVYWNKGYFSALFSPGDAGYHQKDDKYYELYLLLSESHWAQFFCSVLQPISSLSVCLRPRAAIVVLSMYKPPRSWPSEKDWTQQLLSEHNHQQTRFSTPLIETKTDSFPFTPSLPYGEK